LKKALKADIKQGPWLEKYIYVKKAVEENFCMCLWSSGGKGFLRSPPTNKWENNLKSPN